MTTEFGSFISFILSCSFSPSLPPPTSILSLSLFFFCSAPPALVPLEKLKGNLGYDENSLRQLREACCSLIVIFIIHIFNKTTKITRDHHCEVP